MEQPSPTPLVEPQLRRSAKEHCPSSKYTTNKYVMLSDGGKLETYQEAMLHDRK